MGCLVIDENILISISVYDKELNGAADSFELLFSLIKFETYAYKCDAIKYLGNLKLIHEDFEFMKNQPEVLESLTDSYGFKLHEIFKNDKNWKYDLFLITYAYWHAKIKGEKCILLTREKRVWKACQLIGVSCCCLLHILDCMVNSFDLDEFRELLNHLRNGTKLTHPNWAYEHSIDCEFFG